MNSADALRMAGRLLAYPDAEYLDGLWEAAETVKDDNGAFANAVKSFIGEMRTTSPQLLAQRHVAIYDHTPAASLYMAWHRYGNDRGQGKAMAALNGLYRSAGFEPLPGHMPDYLPRMLEFLSLAPDWACEALLDGFGPEIAALLKTLRELDSPHVVLLELALSPFTQKYPEHFKPRTGADPTIRPMARPEPEPCEPLIPVPGKMNFEPVNPYHGMEYYK